MANPWGTSWGASWASGVWSTPSNQSAWGVSWGVSWADSWGAGEADECTADIPWDTAWCNSWGDSWGIPSGEATHGRVFVSRGAFDIITDDEELMEILAHVIPAIV